MAAPWTSSWSLPVIKGMPLFHCHLLNHEDKGMMAKILCKVPGLYRRNARLGEAIWGDSGRYRIPEVHPDLCPATTLHQDPRYFPSHRRTLILRSWYAVTRVVITRSDNGDETFNTSEFLGALFTSALQNSYYPRHDRTFGETMNRFSGALSSDALGNLLREFTPDILPCEL